MYIYLSSFSTADVERTDKAERPRCIRLQPITRLMYLDMGDRLNADGHHIRVRDFV